MCGVTLYSCITRGETQMKTKFHELVEYSLVVTWKETSRWILYKETRLVMAFEILTLKPPGKIVNQFCFSHSNSDMMDLCELIRHEKVTNTGFQEYWWTFEWSWTKRWLKSVRFFFYNFDNFLHEEILLHNFTCKLLAKYKASLKFSNWEYLT